MAFKAQGYRLQSHRLQGAITLALLALTGLSACSSSDDFEAPSPLPDIVSDVDLDKVWGEYIGDGLDGQLLFLQPVIRDDLIYAVDAHGDLEVQDYATGQDAWSRDLDEPVIAGLGADAQHLYLVTLAGQLLALNRNDGQEIWRASLPSEVLAPPTSDGDRVILQTIDGKLLTFDTANGKKLWQYDSVVPVLSYRGTSAVVIRGSVTLAALDNGQLVALDTQNGSPLWQYAVGLPSGRTELERLVDVDGTPLLDDGLALVVGYQGRLAAIDIHTGQELWSREASSLQSPVLGSGNAFVATADGQIAAFNVETHAEVWRQKGLAWRQLTAPMTLGDYLLVGDFEGYLHLLSQKDGQFVGRLNIDSDGVRVPILKKDELIFVYSNGGKLNAYRIEE